LAFKGLSKAFKCLQRFSQAFKGLSKGSKNFKAFRGTIKFLQRPSEELLNAFKGF